VAKKRTVWVGVFNPAPDSIPKPPRIEAVFSTESQARQWERAFDAQGAWSAYRSIHRFEVDAWEGERAP